MSAAQLLLFPRLTVVTLADGGMTWPHCLASALDPAAIPWCFIFFHLVERPDGHLRDTKALDKEVVQRLFW